MNIQLSHLHPQFHEAAYALFCSHREQPWSFELFLKSVSGELSLYAIENDTLIAFAIFTLVAGEGELEDICVKHEYRGKGIGASLIEHFVSLPSRAHMDYLLLEVNENNHAAKRLYQNSGFKVVGKRKDYYAHKDGTFSNALIMQKFV